MEDTRQEVWMRAWCATSNANDCKSPQTATAWADKCLAEFDKRFKVKTKYTPFTPKRKD